MWSILRYQMVSVVIFRYILYLLFSSGLLFLQRAGLCLERMFAHPK
jgi:hypothetical protein